MENIKDEIIDCPKTGGNLCYVTQVSPDIKNYISLSSGYWTNSLMKKDSQFYKEQLEKLPELYKDCIWEDTNTGLIWIPQTINNAEKGMVFLNGNNKNNIHWAAVKSISVKEEEKHKYPIRGKVNTFYERRMDMDNLKQFEMNEFIDALSYIGVLK